MQRGSSEPDVYRDTNGARRGPSNTIRPVVLRMLCILSCVFLATETTQANPASPEVSAGEHTPLGSTNTVLTTYLEDLGTLVSAEVTSDADFRSGSVPHAIVYLHEGRLPEGSFDQALQAALDLARNDGLVVEYQVTPSAPRMAGVIVSPPFPTLQFCWESHPFEEVPTRDGLWSQPFADMGDVSEVRVEGDAVTLRFERQAVERIDRQAEVHGHRRYYIRATGGGAGVKLGPYIWMPGLGRIQGLPRSLDAWSESAGVSPKSLDEIHRQFDDRQAARIAVAAHLNIGQHALWTAPLERPRFRESVVLWATQDGAWREEVPAYVPWLDGGEDGPRWVALRAATPPEKGVAIAVPWRLEPPESTTDDRETLRFVPDPSMQNDIALQEFVRRHHGGEVAVVLAGQVAGIVPVEALRQGRLTLSSLDPGAVAAIVATMPTADESATVGSDGGRLKRLTKAETPLAQMATAQPPDFFQVRLMAEPQERKLIPVTHFAAPGSPSGVRVAVQNDIILDSSAVTGARLVREADDRLYLHLSLTEAGQDALSGVCFSNLGKQLAIVYEDQLLCAPTIVDWELEDLSFKGMNEDWPQIAEAMMARLGNG